MKTQVIVKWALDSLLGRSTSGVACLTPSQVRTASILEIRCSRRAKKKSSKKAAELQLQSAYLRSLRRQAQSEGNWNLGT